MSYSIGTVLLTVKHRPNEVPLRDIILKISHLKTKFLGVGPWDETIVHDSL